jgi:hypothetical protein
MTAAVGAPLWADKGRGKIKKRGRGGRAGQICFRAALFFTGSGSHGRLPPLSPRDGKERVKNG